MSLNVGREMTTLQQMTVKQLRQRYVEVFGEETNGHNKPWLIRRIAWRIQAQAEGGLSERVRRLAAELANDADMRMNPPLVRDEAPVEEVVIRELPFRPNERLPPPGTIIVRKYQGRHLQVRVLNHGFDFEGTIYRSLSAVAKAITGSHYNGYQFFRLTRKRGGA